MSGSASSSSRLAAVTAAALLLTFGAVRAQQPGRVATTASQLLADAVFFHGRQVAIRGNVVQSGSLTRLAVDDTVTGPDDRRTHPIFIFWRETPERADGEIRGQFYDLGRLREDDPRFSGYDFRTLLEAASNGRWPGRDELFALVGASMSEAPVPTAPSLRAIALDPARFADRGVTVTGRFRGRNLYGDLASAPNRSRWDFVLQSADAAVWISDLRPRGRGFDLDPGARVDTGVWVEVSGTVHVEGPEVWIQGDSIREATEPADEAPPEITPAIPLPSPEVVFSAPVPGEADVPPGSRVRVQFSQDMAERSFRGQVRVSYVAAQGGEAPPPVPEFTTAYRGGTRALEITFATPLAPFQTVRIEMLDGIASAGGQPLIPWTLTFVTGG